ncbi:hypothetical protein BKA81DRAFT_41186 [Phyllosticta paracitricarpa]
MVYTGKPSRGCQTCKSRRIRCDEGRPTCQNCQKSGRSCPGFPDEFDLMFRNENAAVVRRVRRQASKTRSSPTTTNSRYDGARAMSIRNSSIALKASGASCHSCDFFRPDCLRASILSKMLRILWFFAFTANASLTEADPAATLRKTVMMKSRSFLRRKVQALRGQILSRMPRALRG